MKNNLKINRKEKEMLITALEEYEENYFPSKSHKWNIEVFNLIDKIKRLFNNEK